MIEATNLTKHYGPVRAVRDVSFSAQAGEVVGLLGPNGAGKTTIMRMLTGFTPPTSGSANIAGFDVTVDSLDARASVGYLPERVPIYPDMTVGEYVAFWARLRGLRGGKKLKAALDTALERVQLTDRADMLVRNLSKGLTQRLGLAQALVHDPPVVILDEPTIGIDPYQVIEVRQLVRELGREKAVLFSTHILTEAEQVCDRVLILNHGQVIAAGSPDELREQSRVKGSLYVELSGPGDAETLLRAVPGVEGLTASGSGYRLQASGDVRGAVSTTAAENGYTLLELRPVSLTLEEMFLDLIGS